MITIYENDAKRVDDSAVTDEDTEKEEINMTLYGVKCLSLSELWQTHHHTTVHERYERRLYRDFMQYEQSHRIYLTSYTRSPAESRTTLFAYVKHLEIN